MHRILAPALLIAASGCATQRAEQKMSFAEVFRRSGDTAPASASRVAGSRSAATASRPGAKRGDKRAEPAGPLLATGSAELAAELARFAHLARQQRGLTPRGGRMPVAQQANWARLLSVMDRFLARPARATVPLDVARARVAAEAELEMDARAYGDLPPELAERVLDKVTELAIRMAALRRLQVVATKPAAVTFDWPIDPVSITSLYGRRLHPISRTWRAHYGVDLDAYPGQLVTAAANGTVVSTGWKGAHGKQVELRHPGGVITRYSHLSAIVVEPGNRVSQGDPIGLAGSTGQSTGAHLHFELWKDGRPRDPLEELSRQPSREAKAGPVPRS